MSKEMISETRRRKMKTKTKVLIGTNLKKLKCQSSTETIQTYSCFAQIDIFKYIGYPITRSSL